MKARGKDTYLSLQRQSKEGIERDTRLDLIDDELLVRQSHIACTCSDRDSIGTLSHQIHCRRRFYEGRKSLTKEGEEEDGRTYRRMSGSAVTGREKEERVK